MIELEKTYLAKFIQEGLTDGKEMLDIYLPKSKEHPVLRIRKKGAQFEMTKKYPVEDDASKQHEHTIPLTEKEFEELEQNVEGKRTEKIRYEFDFNGRKAEVDVFQGKLKGLILVDFEFNTEEEKEKFKIPDFCLKEVTKEEFIAGGMLCGKSYEDIKDRLGALGYRRLE